MSSGFEIRIYTNPIRGDMPNQIPVTFLLRPEDSRYNYDPQLAKAMTDNGAWSFSDHRPMFTEGVVSVQEWFSAWPTMEKVWERLTHYQELVSKEMTEARLAQRRVKAASDAERGE